MEVCIIKISPELIQADRAFEKTRREFAAMVIADLKADTEAMILGTQETKMKNEKTSKRVASIAGKVLERTKSLIGRKDVCVWLEIGHRVDDNTFEVQAGWTGLCTIAELRALAASALTQRVDRVGYGESIHVGPPLELHKIRTKSQAEKAAIKKAIATFHKPPKRKPARKGRK